MARVRTIAGQSDGLADEVTDLRPELEAIGEERKSRSRLRSRRITAVVLVVLTSLAVVVATVAVWLRATVLDTDRFMETVTPALESPEVQLALSQQLSEEVTTALDVENRVETILLEIDANLTQRLLDAVDAGPLATQVIGGRDRSRITALAGTIGAAIDARITDLVDRVVTSPDFQDLILDVTRVGHTKAVALLREDYDQLPNVVVESGEVQLNTLPLIAEVLRRLAQEGLDALGLDATIPTISSSDDPGQGVSQLASALGVDLPPDFGQVTIMQQQQLEELQTAVRLADLLVWVMVLLALALAVITVLVSPTRRRTLVQLAVGVSLGLLLAGVLIRNVHSAIVGAITDPDGQAAADSVAASVMGSLRGVALIVFLAALLLGVAAFVAGHPEWFDRLRIATAQGPGGSEVDRFVARRFDLLRIGGAAVALLALWLLGIGFVSLLVVGGVLAIFLWWLGAARARVTTEAEPTTNLETADTNAGNEAES